MTGRKQRLAVALTDAAHQQRARAQVQACLDTIAAVDLEVQRLDALVLLGVVTREELEAAAPHFARLISRDAR